MTLNIPNRQRWLIGIAAGGLLLMILDNVVFTPLTHAWESNSAEIAKLKTEVADGRGIITRGPRLQQTWSGMRSASLPHDPAQAEHDVISGFEAWSRTSGVELGSIKPLWKRGETDEYSVLECHLDATGSLGALTRFLYELGKAPLALRLESMELISRDESGDRITLNIMITGLRLTRLEGKS